MDMFSVHTVEEIVVRNMFMLPFDHFHGVQVV